MNISTNGKTKSVKSINQCKSVVQTNYVIIKAHGGVPIAIGIKVKTEENQGFGVYYCITLISRVGVFRQPSGATGIRAEVKRKEPVEFDIFIP